MDKMKCIKNSLVELVYGYCDKLETVETKEMGEIIDMIKDMAEAIYYCTATQAMNEKYGVSEHTMDELISDIIELSTHSTEEEKQMIKNKIMAI